MNGHDCADRKETYVTKTLSARSSRALTVCSLLVIIASIPALRFELYDALSGVPAATAGIAVGASCLSALVGLVFLAVVARGRPSILSWIAAFAWGTGGALIMAGFGNDYVDGAVEASALRSETVYFVTSVVTGPVVEESVKGIGVLILVLAARAVLERPSQGAVLGALVGLGFAWGEDIGYYVAALKDGMSGLWESFLARALLGAFGHAIFTGVFGFALCWAILRAKNVFVGIAAGLGGFAGAVLLHAQANGVGFLAPEDSWNLTYGAIEVPILAVSVALLVWGLRRRRATLEA